MRKVPDTPENMSRCLCGSCPSFPGLGGFFCAVGKSASEIRKRGCVCADCPNFREFSLTDGYYCDAGAAGEGAQ
jgi:aldose sugar dehydrogenase